MKKRILSPLQEAASKWDYLYNDPEFRKEVGNYADNWVSPIIQAASYGAKPALAAALRQVEYNIAQLSEFGVIAPRENLLLATLPDTDSYRAMNPELSDRDVKIELLRAYWSHQIAWDIFREVEDAYYHRRAGRPPKQVTPSVTSLSKHLRTVFCIDFNNTWAFYIRMLPRWFGKDQETVIFQQAGEMLWRGMGSLDTFKRIKMMQGIMTRHDAEITAFDAHESEEFFRKSRNNLATFWRKHPRFIANKLAYEVTQSRSLEQLPDLDQFGGVGEDGYNTILQESNAESILERVRKELIDGPLRSRAPLLYELFLDIQANSDSTDEERAERLKKDRTTITRQRAQLGKRIQHILMETAE